MKQEGLLYWNFKKCRSLIKAITQEINKDLGSSFVLTALIACALLFIIASQGNAQNHQWARWFHPINNYANDAWDVSDVKTDSLSNVYVIARFRSPITTGVDTIAPHYAGSDDIIIAKFSKDGEKLWHKVIGGTWYDSPHQLQINDTAVFLAAFVQGDTLIIGNAGFDNKMQHQVIIFDYDGNLKDIHFHHLKNYVLGMDLSHSAFYIRNYYSIVKYREFPKPAEKQISFVSRSFQKLTEMYITDNDQKIITGIFGNSISYQDTSLEASIPGDGYAAFIVKLDKNDSLLWMHRFGKIQETTSQPVCLEMSADSNIYMSFHYTGTIEVLGKELIPLNPRAHNTLVCIDKDGTLLWDKTFYSLNSGGISIRDLHIVDENLFIAGDYTNSAMVYDEKDTLQTNGKSNNTFILKADLQGETTWIHYIGASGGSNRLNKITDDGKGNFFGGGLTYTNIKPSFGCVSYPDINGGLFFHFKDETPNELPRVQFKLSQQNEKYFFSSSISNSSNYAWDFDDGSELASNLQNPSHIFNGKGLFNVTLTASNECGDKSYTKQLRIDGLKQLTPSMSASTNYFSGTIHGAGLKPGASYKLLLDNTIEYPIKESYFRWPHAVDISLILKDAPIGDYDLVMTLGEETDTLKAALNIEENMKPEIEVAMSGPGVVLSNRYFQYRMTVTNKSNVNLPAVPIAIIAKEYHDIKMLNDFADDSIMTAVFNELGSRFLTDTLPNDEIIKIGLFAVPFLRAGETFTFKLALKTAISGDNHLRFMSGTNFIDLETFTDPELKRMGLSNGMQGGSCFGSKCADCLMSFTTYVPVLGCATGLISLGCSVRDAVQDGSVNKGEAFDLGIGVVGTALSCGGVGAIGNAAKKSARASLEYLELGSGLAEIGLGTAGVEGACGGGNCSLGDLGEFFFPSRASFDPNEKYGIRGFTAENYIRPDKTLEYTITFENKDTATAPASEVYIYDTLDTSKYDLASFQWRSFGFGDTSLIINSSGPSFIQDVDIRSDRNIIVRFEGMLDSLGVIKVKFTSLDTATYALTENILDGFLPPNVTSPEGEGFIHFAISLKDNVMHGDKIENKAQIVFDANEAIVTGTWINTIDTVAPVSLIRPLATQTKDTLIYLRWDGNDENAGIQSYDVYFSEDSGEFKSLFKNISGNEAVLIGELGKSYGFYVEASDFAGNIEKKEKLAEAETRIEILTSQKSLLNSQSISVFPNPTSDNVEISFVKSLENAAVVKVIDIHGRELLQQKVHEGERIIKLKIAEVARRSGTYFILIHTHEEKPVIVPITFVK